MKNKFLKILGIVAGVGLALVIVFQVILTMNTNAIKNSSPTAVNSATSNSSDKEIIAEALNTDFKSYKFKVKNSPGIQATRTWTGEYQNDPLKAQAKVDKTFMWLNEDKVYQKMWDNTGSPKWKASSTMTPNKVVSQFDPAIILSGSKAIKSDMKLKKSGSVYRVSYSGNSSLQFWNKTHSKLIKKLKGNASGLDNEGALKRLKVEYTLKEKGGHLVLTSFSFYLRFAYAGYDISQEGTYTEINAIKVSTPNALKSKTSKKRHIVYHPKADDSFDIDIDSNNSNTQSSQSSESSSSSQQSSSSQSSKSEEHKEEKQESQSQSSTPTQSSDNKGANQQSQANNSNNTNASANNNQNQAQNNQQPAANQQSH